MRSAPFFFACFFFLLFITPRCRTKKIDYPTIYSNYILNSFDPNRTTTSGSYSTTCNQARKCRLSKRLLLVPLVKPSANKKDDAASSPNSSCKVDAVVPTFQTLCCNRGVATVAGRAAGVVQHVPCQRRRNDPRYVPKEVAKAVPIGT